MTPPKIVDPIRFVEEVWPHIKLYRQQKEILYSLVANDETIVVAGNALGKDFVSAIAILWWMCSRRPARGIATSVDAKQLETVLWGEIGELLRSAKVNLPIRYTHMMLHVIDDEGNDIPKCDFEGRTVSKEAGILGRHLPKDVPRTLLVIDEASGVGDATYNGADTWAHRILIIGNPFPCQNFFYRGVKGGDLESSIGSGLFRKVIKIKAEDSPNIRLARSQERAGKVPTNEILIPGVKDYYTYLKNRQLWDKIRQCVSLDAEFYEGAENLLYPPDWLNKSEEVYRKLSRTNRQAMSMGVDTGEGAADTSWTIIDELGIIKKVTKKTPDTSVISGETLGLMKEYNLRPDQILFDAGGGGKQIADMLRADGYNVRTVRFGESAVPEKHLGLTPIEIQKLEQEERYVYLNRRAQMYGLLSLRLDPDTAWRESQGTPIFAIGSEYVELRRQLAPIPKWYDKEGRLYLPPKNRKPGTDKTSSSVVTLIDLLGCSPDEADSLVLAIYGLEVAKSTVSAGVAF